MLPWSWGAARPAGCLLPARSHLPATLGGAPLRPSGLTSPAQGPRGILQALSTGIALFACWFWRGWGPNPPGFLPQGGQLGRWRFAFGGAEARFVPQHPGKPQAARSLQGLGELQQPLAFCGPPPAPQRHRGSAEPPSPPPSLLTESQFANAVLLNPAWHFHSELRWAEMIIYELHLICTVHA